MRHFRASLVDRLIKIGHAAARLNDIAEARPFQANVDSLSPLEPVSLKALDTWARSERRVLSLYLSRCHSQFAPSKCTKRNYHTRIADPNIAAKSNVADTCST
jgi:hypothetical protein